MARGRIKQNGRPESPYPDGTPVDDATGMPRSEADITPETAKQVGFDAQSARRRKQYRQVVEARAGGVKNIKWNADPRLKYSQMFTVHPDAKVCVKQIEPYVDESLDDQFVRAFPTYGDLRKYIKDNHWRGDKATYLFEFASASHAIIGEGKIYFQADPEWAQKKEEEDMRRQQPPQNPYPLPQYGQPPPQQSYGQPPPQGYGPPGYGYPPPGYGYQQPPQVVVQQQPPPPMAPPPAPPAADAGGSAFLQYLIQQNQWLATRIEQLQAHHSQVQAQPQQPQQGTDAQWWAYFQAEKKRMEDEFAAKLTLATAKPPEPPRNPLDQMKETVEMITSVTTMRDKLVGPVKEEPEPAKTVDDDGWPILAKQVGPITLIADKATKEIIKDPVLNMMFNAGNIEDGADKLLKKAETFWDKVKKQNKEEQDRALEIEQTKLANARERTELMKQATDAAERRKLIEGAAQQVLTAPEPRAITQSHAEAIAERPSVVVEAEPVVARPPPWRKPETPPASAGSADAAPRKDAGEESSDSGIVGPVAAEESEKIADTEPPQPVPEPAPEAQPVAE